MGGERGPLQAHKAGAGDVIVQGTQTKTLRFDQPVVSIAMLESDEQGRVYLATTCRRADDKDPWKTEIVLAVIDSDGGRVRSLSMPNAYITDHYRKLCVSRSGEIIQMQTAEDGVSFIRRSLGGNASEGAGR